MKLATYEKYINFLCFIFTIFLAYITFKDILINPNLDSIIWLIIHGTVAILFLIRSKPLDYSRSKTAYLIALCSINYYFLYDLSIDQNTFISGFGITITSLGGILCIISTVSLGRCFGLFPMNRGIKTRYAYKFIRHPIYLSYIILDFGIILSYFSWGNLIIYLVAILLFILRIRFEKDILSQSHEYLEYKKKVRYRLIPYFY